MDKRVAKRFKRQSERVKKRKEVRGDTPPDSRTDQEALHDQFLGRLGNFRGSKHHNMRNTARLLKGAKSSGEYDSMSRGGFA